MHDRCRSFEGTWEKLSQVAVKGAEYDSPERQPHPKCLDGTRVVLLNHIHELLDNRGKSRFIWLHGTAGVGKSAVAFTIAERMRGLKVTEQTTVEKQLAGTFFFSRKHTKRCMTGHFFATLVYQLASNFPSIREDVSRAIRENPALLDPDKSLPEQMRAFFLEPLLNLRFRLRESPPLVFVVDALDECASEAELSDLISLLGDALRDPELPVTHILLTSRSEEHIREAFEQEKVLPLVHEIPVKTSGEGVASIISLDGADVDNDIYIFLEHSFRKLRSRRSNFPQPTKDQVARLASRAGRRFIVASTMMNFIDDGYNDPHDRLHLMLELTSELLPGTEVYKLYDHILSTCAEPERAYLHLSVVAALADPLPISQISKLLGPGQGSDVEKALVQLRCLMDIPTDRGLPVNIYHSSIREYVSNPSNCSLPQIQHITPPHTLLAHSSFRLMMQDLPKSTMLLDELSRLQTQRQAMLSRQPEELKVSLSFIVQPPEPLHILLGLLFIRECRSPSSWLWLEALDGRAWLQTEKGKCWLESQRGVGWLQSHWGIDWQQTQAGKDWLKSRVKEAGQSGEVREPHRRVDRFVNRYEPRDPVGMREWAETVGERQGGIESLDTRGEQEQLEVSINGTGLGCFRETCKLQTSYGLKWLETQSGKAWLLTWDGRDWLETANGRDWLESPTARDWLHTWNGQNWLKTRSGGDWLMIPSGRKWLQTMSAREWLQTRDGREWLQTPSGREWQQTPSLREWLQSHSGREWLQTPSGVAWLQIQEGRDWLQTPGGQEWLQAPGGQEWLQTVNVGGWLQTPSAREWLQTKTGQGWLESLTGRVWLETRSAREWLETVSRESQYSPKWLQTPNGLAWLRTPNGKGWLQDWSGQKWLQTRSGQDWLQKQAGQDWLQTPNGRYWLQTQNGRAWLRRPSGQFWLQSHGGQSWLQAQGGRNWLQTQSGQMWLQTQPGQEWLQTLTGRKWLCTPSAREWLRTLRAREWLKTQSGREWLQSPSGQEWLQSTSAQEWLQTQTGQEWLQTQPGHEWLQTPTGREWLQIPAGREWLQTLTGREWLQTPMGREWLQTPSAQDWLQTTTGREWLQTQTGREWLQTQAGREWLQTQTGWEWLQTQTGREWLQTPKALEWLQTQSPLEWLQTHSAREWLQTQPGREWLQTPRGRDWLQTSSAREWLETPTGQEWLETPHGHAWQLTPAASVWVTMEEFWETLKATEKFMVVPEFSSLPTLQVIQQFKNLPDFLMFPVFLALRPKNHFTLASPDSYPMPDIEILHTLKAFISSANESQERTRSASNALVYASQNWSTHLSQVPLDDALSGIFKAFWNNHLLSWLEMQWHLKGLRSCLIILSEGQELAKEHFLRAPESSRSPV